MEPETKNLSKAVDVALLQVLSLEPNKMPVILSAVRTKMVENGYAFDDWDEGTTATNAQPRWAVRTRVRAATLAKLGLLISHGGGQYSLGEEETSSDDAEDVVALDEVELVEGASGTIYAFTYPAYHQLGWLKIGSAADFDLRWAQHLKDAKKAAIPEMPVVVYVWKVAKPIDYERAVQRILSIRGKKRGNAGVEWYQTTVAEVDGILAVADGADMPPTVKVSFTSSKERQNLPNINGEVLRLQFSTNIDGSIAVQDAQADLKLTLHKSDAIVLRNWLNALVKDA